MADAQLVTGDSQVDSDLAALFALAQSKEKLAVAAKAARDDSLKLEQLREAIPEAVLRISLALLDEMQAKAIAAAVEKDDQREKLQRATDLVSSHFRGLDRHPAVVAALRAELARRTPQRDDGDNRIVGVGWEAIWTEDDGKLVPAVRFRLRGDADKLLLSSTLDWDDIAFLIRALCRVLERHMGKSKPVQDAKLLFVDHAAKIGERLGQAQAALGKVIRLAEGFSIAVKSPQSADDQEGGA